MTKGIRVSQQGVPVGKAADYQKTMDERWPVVEMSFMGIVDGVFSDTTPGTRKNAAGSIYHIPVFHHGLGFTPGYRFIQIAASRSSSGNTLAFSSFADDQDIWVVVYPDSNNAPVTFTFKFFVGVFGRDLTQSFTSPIADLSPGEVTASSDYGLKIAKQISAGAMSIDDKSQYSIHSNAKSLAYQAHGIQPAETSGTYNGSLIIPHRLGYAPTYFIASRGPQAGSANPSLGKITTGRFFPGFGIAFADSINVRIRGAQATLVGEYLYLILKEPVEFSK